MFCTKKIVGCIILSLLCIAALAQKLTVRGKIIDKAGTIVPYTVISIKGAKSTALSDFDGKFTLVIPKKTSTILITALGYRSAEKRMKERDFKDSVASIIITMEVAAVLLDEVAVPGSAVAYESKREATHAVSSVYTKRRYRTGAAKRHSHAGKTSGTHIASPVCRTRGTDITTTGIAMHKGETSGAITPVDKDTESVEKKSSLLTAGEVNDFKKWKMWEDYNEADFKTHSQKWCLYATQRYSVQLQNQEHKAIVGETVYLVNKSTKEIIWSAISDNTGKAELWNGFSNNNKEKNLAIEVKGEKNQFIAIPFSQGINHIKLDRACTATNKIEIAFVVDATGSMGDEIEYLKEELGDILTKFTMKQPLLELYTSAVFYRDKLDEYVTRVQPFTKNLGTTLDFIKKQSANGGGDYPEALKEALQDATQKLKWSNDARTKIIFLLMDAPPHDAAKKEMPILIAKAASIGIRIVPVACSGTDKATEFIMRSIALATNGTYLFLTDDSGIGNPHIKPTTDEFKVELLNSLILRVMEQMCFANSCEQTKDTKEPVSIYSNTEKVKIYPNPTLGPVTIETDKELVEIFVADFTGKIIMRSQIKDTKGKYKIDLSGLPSATYLIRYITKDNKTGAEKIIVIH